MACECKDKECKGYCEWQCPTRERESHMNNNFRKKPTYQKRVITVCGNPITFFDCDDKRIFLTIQVPNNKLY